MFIDRSIQSVEIAAFSPATDLKLSARLGRAPVSKWARDAGEGPVVAVVTAGLFVLAGLLVVATVAQSLV